MVTQKPRQIAVNILRSYLEKHQFIDKIADQELSDAQLIPSDRALTLELAYGVVRWQATLDWLIRRKARQSTQKATLQILLRLGLYQIFWLDRIPDHAAVHETVQRARELGFGPQAGFVNALLRDYLREREATVRLLEELKRSQPAIGYSHPEWLCRRWQERWGVPTLCKLLEWNNTPARTGARLNTLQTNAAALTEAWRAEGVEFRERSCDWIPSGWAYEILSAPHLATLPSFQKGFYYLQDPSTLLAVQAMDPKPGESILDFCAAPGGKTTCMAQLMQNRGYIMAQDLDIHRRMAVRENCNRLGVSIVQISRATTAINFDLSEPFDKVLVDTPCSNTGVMRRRVDLRWRLTPEDLPRLHQTQVTILERAARQVKSGGCLVYSTCSLEREENQDMARKFMEMFPDYKLEFERELTPFNDALDGAYVARFRLDGPTPRPEPLPPASFDE